ncbi:hypothetical protein BDB00DRAFT_831063 [Zychaea mexicana]|uniref:uncharacterized protein n=1 Tax=Zychaea mexicana TaxID=64656 RepID=UPI0022FDD6FE|nr:uncharacterized protein BDB00DRAFT_831063 [Zychaea mexicana]KAI9491888.1 hypothetical protein BDB00DRAFT_831063 [Zychaea mexicana]
MYLFPLFFSQFFFNLKMNDDIVNVITNTITNLDSELRSLSLKIHDNPELPNQEYNACHLLEDYLEEKGFKVMREAAGMPTAFMAEYTNGPGKRVAYCSEYDALPGVGHACGHNLIAIAGVACAMAVKALLEQNLLQGTVTLFGTPAEEGGNGKVTFVKELEFQKRADFAMMLHPAPADSVVGPALAIDAVTIEFFGKASHAGMAPWNGINALDALMQGYNNVSMLRQQTLPTNRIHGNITHGGNSANVIPDYASAKFLIRSVTRTQLAELKSKFENCFKAAAGATGCRLSMSWLPNGATDDMFTNDTLAASYQHFMEEEGVKFPTSEEAGSISMASSDFGNVSYVLPSLQPVFKIDTSGPNHTHEFAKAARTKQAHQATLRASQCLAKTAAEMYLNPAMFEKAWKDFRKGKPQ